MGIDTSTLMLSHITIHHDPGKTTQNKYVSRKILLYNKKCGLLGCQIEHDAHNAKVTG